MHARVVSKCTQVVIEPDSLPNLATNLENPRCGNLATQAAYKRGIAYAVRKLHEEAPHATLYLDAGHGGWCALSLGSNAATIAAARTRIRAPTHASRLHPFPV